MCEELLANPLIESFEIEVDGRRDATGRAIAVVVFPGSNDDRDAAWALGALGAEPVLVWHADERAAAGIGGGRAPRRLLVRRLPALRRDRARSRR